MLYFEIDGKRYIEQTIYSGWRVLHAAEGGYPNPNGFPAVHPGDNANIPVQMTKEIQLMSYELNEGRITKLKWRALYGSTVAFTNGQSWYQRVCKDYVNNRDLLAMEDDKPSLPKLMKGIIMSGMFVRGDVIRDEGKDWLEVTPGIGAIDATKLLPTLQEIKDMGWYMRAITSADNPNNILGSTVPLLVPYLLNAPTRYPLEWFEPWNEDFLPDPIKFYR